MKFGQAIELMNQGKKLTRKSWNNTNMVVVYQESCFDGEPCNFEKAKALKCRKGFYSECNSTFPSKYYSDGTYDMWNVTQSDMSAEDWEVV